VRASPPDDSEAEVPAAPQAYFAAAARDGPQACFVAEVPDALPVDSEAEARVWFLAVGPAAAPAVGKVANSVSRPEADSGFSPADQYSEALVAVPALPVAEALVAAVRPDKRPGAGLDSALADWHSAVPAFGPVVRAAAERAAADR